MDCQREIGKTELQRPELSYEWLDTNGLGGYASSTAVGCNTRKYHGLLVSPVPGGSQRFVFLSRIETSIVADSGEYELSTNQYPGVLHPQGYRYATRFVLDRTPHFFFEAGGWKIQYRIAMRHEHPSVMLQYTSVGSKGKALLKLRPFFAYRDFSATASENRYADMSIRHSDSSYVIAPYDGMPPTVLTSSMYMTYTAEPDWHRSTEYLRELERGYDYREDLFTPGCFAVELKPETEFVLCASLGEPLEDPEPAFTAEMKRRAKRNGSEGLLHRGANHFLVSKKRSGKASVIAGFPWFGEWGRDAMISLPGLTLCRGMHDEAFGVLESFASFEKNGLFPNQLDVYGGSSYNTVDASLWFFWAVQMYVRYGGDIGKIKSTIQPTLRNILIAYVTGQVPFGIVRQDGLLDVGNEDTQLTWMDAKVHGRPVTPRFGRPVEINALWINALQFYAELVDEPFSSDLEPLEVMRESAADAFLETFWIDDYGYLADVVYPDGTIDASIRPNQIFAVSLPHSPVSDEQAKRIVNNVEKHLLTPYGLRTLSPTHVKYKGRYEGDQDTRDGAYHQGTVWPWLIGHFVEAFLRVHKDEPSSIEKLRSFLSPLLLEHVETAGLGSVSEVFDGDEPHRPGGCPMQAWSVAEVIRASARLNESMA